MRFWRHLRKIDTLLRKMAKHLILVFVPESPIVYINHQLYLEII